jgi:hypothetical protein
MRITALLLLPFAVGSMPTLAQAPDLSGIWVSVTELGKPLSASSLPMTQAAMTKLADFDPRRLDSTYFCMPFGTPRNTLNTSTRPLKIIQTPTQITLLFDGLGDVRRVFVDGRPHPEDPIPSWMGYSIGAWNGKALDIDTVAMTSESILTEEGLPHSDAMQMHEQLRLVEQAGETLLQIDMQLEDPENYSAPLTATRYFRRAPHAQLSEGSSQCLLDQWRRRLEDTTREMYRDLQAATSEQAQ